jgi:hypothetical protein
MLAAEGQVFVRCRRRELQDVPAASGKTMRRRQYFSGPTDVPLLE